MNIPIGQASNIDYVFIQDSSSTTGAGLTGITSGSSGLAGRYIYPGGTSVALTFETITTLGTYQAPTSNAHLRIKELDATNHPGVYEIHYHNDWFSTANARKAAILTIKGVTNMAQLNHKVTIDYALQPTTAARTLDVASTGEAGLDYTNVNGTVGDSAGTTTLLARIGAFTGSGVNTVLGLFKALLSKTATTPSDVGGTFDPATDSTEAIRDQGDSAWTTIAAAAIRTAIGLGTANLDSQLSNIEAETSELLADWANGGRLDLLLDAILGDTNELQGDWTNGGRLDLILDTIASDAAAIAARLTTARAGYLDNLNVGGSVASQADINALNQSASRRVILTAVQQFERPESSSVTYDIEARLYDGDGAAVNADSTPTLTATGSVSGSLAANLSASSNPATGVYRWTYTVPAAHAIEQIRFDISAVISSSTFTLSLYSQVTDQVSATFTSTDQSHLTSIFNKLPSKSYLAGSSNSDGDVQMDEATGNFPGSVASVLALGTQAKLDVNAEADTALADYDAPTKAEMDAGFASADDAVLAAIAALNNLSSAGAQAAAEAALAAYNAAQPGDAMILDLTQALDTTPVEDSVGQALIGAISELGDETVVGTVYTKKTPSGATAVIFDLDDADAPTSRTRQ